MNLFAGSVDAGSAGGLTLKVGPHRLALDAAALASHPAVREKLAQPVIVGVRPEALSDVALEPGVPADRVVEATVDLVEALGSELVVHVSMAEPPRGGDGVSDAWRLVVARRGRAVARLSTRSRVAAGEVIKLAVDTNRLHLFDAESGESLRTVGVTPPPARTPAPVSAAGPTRGKG
jgi:multiple sugar transport system ATP-binding protein